MHSESDIRKSIKVLLEAYGALTTSEVKQHLDEVLIFDDDDLQPSTTRNEALIMQRIGNVVSHQSSETLLYNEGFLVDKNKKPALWVLASGLPGYEQRISDNRINLLRKNLGNYSSRRYRKINWEEVNERNSSLGMCGEEFVYFHEIEEIRSINPNLTDKIQHLSAHQGDGFGYDILSVDKNGNSKYIEVKTTKSKDPLSPFYMSINERNFFEERIGSNAYIYRLYDFNMQSRNGKIKIISAQDLFKDFVFDPISFKVYPRG